MAQTVPFSKQMRLATRDIHSVSDALVNAKLAFALYDSRVWAEGLLIFYDIFKHLEQHVPHDFLPPEIHRTAQFEQDLRFFLGDGWLERHTPKPEVRAYLNHLHEIEQENANLLLAYVYHLYMGLLSGGQILQKRRSLGRRINPFRSADTATVEGAALTTFENHSIYELKQHLRKIVDEFGARIDDETRQRMLEESRKVFELNNTIIKTVEGVGSANVRTVLYVGMVIAALIMAQYILRNNVDSKQDR
ncbi:heme oxygenase 1 [Anopheles maculipalpis]|uniref:heme oxygenase 1 n=1 Tax=Anopheles maculipalpis TaxID=1496333 RepID=UPI002159B5E3|nr:heme oxygenase 1 [Anopheles maculipalpis]XP_050070924.1 heme oxygenase 1 [Anopheles maculipalpis]XP_050070925.1 heme oxygenase 1 [Anopheles maculipalpis]